MSTARIVCTVFEDALQLAERLSLSFDVVEIVEPGAACKPADLEINLEWCSLDEALASVSSLLEARGAFDHQWPLSLAKVRKWEADPGGVSHPSHAANFPQVDDIAVNSKLQPAHWAGSNIAAAGQYHKLPATASATNPPAALIKARGRGSRFIDWLHRFCPLTQGQLLP